MHKSSISKIVLIAIVVILIAVSAGAYAVLKGGADIEKITEEENIGMQDGAVGAIRRGALSVDFPLKPNHELYIEHFPSFAGPYYKIFDVTVKNSSEIQAVEELIQPIDTLDAEEEALAFVQFFTDDDTRFALKDSPFDGIEPKDVYQQLPSLIMSKLTPTRVTSDDEKWIIERDVLLYPKYRTVNSKLELLTPAQLVRSREVVIKTGGYVFEVRKILMEGDMIDGVLIYYE